MKRTLYATAFAAVIALAPPALAQSGQESGKSAPPPSAQNAPMPHPMGRRGGLTGGGMGPGPAGGPGRGMPWGRGMMGSGNPEQLCIDRVAHRVARLAYVGTELDLTAQQRPLWQKVAATASDVAQKEVELCHELAGEGTKTVLDRLNLVRRMLSTRLAGFDAALPELKALYEALTPEQRAILDQPWGER